jgi:carboxyl-terminal processing protease
MAKVKIFFSILVIFTVSIFAQMSYENWELFKEVYSLVKNTYIDEKSSDQIIVGALKGLANATGAESGYIPKEKVEEFEKIANLNYQIPFYITKDEGFARIMSVFGENGTGVEPGDYLRIIDGNSAFDMSYPDLQRMIKSDEEKEFKCEFLKKGTLKKYAKTIKSVKYEEPKLFTLPKNQKVLQIRCLESDISPKLKEELEKTTSPIIVDLRNCASDNIEKTLKWCGFLFGKGEVKCSAKGGYRSLQFEGEGVLSSKKCALLVDKTTARGGEILSMVGSAKFPLIGENTFGFASQHEKLILKNGDALVILIGYFLNKNGEEVKEKPLKPDFVIDKMDEKNSEKIYSEVVEKLSF